MALTMQWGKIGYEGVIIVMKIIITIDRRNYGFVITVG
jgi:hypothetical protein